MNFIDIIVLITAGISLYIGWKVGLIQALASLAGIVLAIILSTQMKDRFKKYFGSSVAIWHSKMTAKEKQHTLKKISLGEYKIIIGARSCIFTPISNLGLIIVDEEQDSSYKQESPRPF